MKNVIILYHPPFRGNIFPIHIIENLQGYRFFILLIDADFQEHKKLTELGCVENVITTRFELENLIEICEDIIKQYGLIDNVAYLDESCVQLAGMLLNRYGISSDNLDRFTNKWLMSQKLKNSEICIPLGILFDHMKYHNNKEEYLLEIENNLNKYPLFIKPSDLSGSRGTCMVSNRNELMRWAEQRTEHTYVIQEYLDGKLFHCESFIRKSKILHFSVFEYSRPGFFFSKGFPVGSISLPPNDLLTKRISRFTESVLENLGIIENGVTHVEVYLDRNDELIFLEAAARPPGLVGNLLYRKHLNISINEIHLLLQLNECNYDLSNLKINNYAARYIFPFPENGKIAKFSDKLKINSLFIENIPLKIGDEVKKSRDLFNVAGTMILWNKNYTELRRDFLMLADYAPFEIQAINPIKEETICP
jgi:hypothetical protein